MKPTSDREGDRELERRAKTQGNLVSGKGCYCGGISRGFLILWAKPEKRGALMHRQLFFRDLTTLDSKQAKVSGGAMFSQLTQLTVSHCPCLELFPLLWHTCFPYQMGSKNIMIFCHLMWSHFCLLSSWAIFLRQFRPYMLSFMFANMFWEKTKTARFMLCLS